VGGGCGGAGNSSILQGITNNLAACNHERCHQKRRELGMSPGK
jgi:hypothetical protein